MKAIHSTDRCPCPGRRTLQWGTAALLAIFSAPGALADFWFQPHPLRRDAISDGRGFDLNAEALAQRFSYRHLSDFPAPGDDGLRGTGGSLTGDDLYHETTVQKHLTSDDGRHGLLFRMRRAEDFDGRFDRQLIGYRYNPSSKLGFTIAGDATGDKSRSDVQFEADWRPGEGRRLRAVLVLPQFLFNDKQQGRGTYEREARTAFVHYSASGEDWDADLALNVSPEARFSSSLVTVAARQLRGAARLGVERSGWHARLRGEFERTRRRYKANEAFQRSYRSLVVEARATHHRLRPTAGLRALRLDESGWFGSASDAVGDAERTEFGVFGGIHLRASVNSWWEPTLQISRVDVDHTFSRGKWRDRDQEEWQAKLLLPWRVRLAAESGAILTLHASIRLHEPGFGGGNIQIQWPF